MRDSEGRAAGAAAAAHNDQSGTNSGNSVQAATIHGDVYFGHQPAPAPRTPRQLPPRPRHFTGRAEQLARLDAVFERADSEGVPGVVMISGPPGVGKTSLALAWLHRRIARLPDGQLFVDLRGHRIHEPIEISTVLPRFLQALGVAPESIPGDLAGQTALFRTVTADRRLAVLCDNAMSAAQVRPLIPVSPGSVCLVTSRWRLTSLALDGAEMFPLGPLDTGSALELLGRIVGQERVAAHAAAARELVTAYGRFPLAVCVGAALLASRPGWSVATAASLVISPHTAAADAPEEVSMNTSLDQFHDALPAEAGRLYRRLGAHPGPEFETELALAVAQAGPPVEDPGGSLATLVEANLLTAAPAGRYRFHDLIQRHAQSRAEAQDSPALRAETERRVIDHYLATANAADAVVSPLRKRPEPHYVHPPESPREFPDTASGIAWFTTEHTNLIATQRLAVEREYDDAVWQLADAMWPLFSYLRVYHDWIISQERGAAAAARLGHLLGEARLRMGLGIALREGGRHREALAVFDEARELRRALGDRRGEGNVLHQAGLTHRRLGDLEGAAACFTEAVEIRGEAADHWGAARGRARLGELASLRGDHRRALDLLGTALATLGEAPPSVHLLIVRRLMGEACLRAGQPAAARAQLLETLEHLGEVGQVFEAGRVHEALAEVAAASGDDETARAHLARAEEVYAEVGAVPDAERVARGLAEPD
ncbi:tetratricopeptide repeat protein [Streptomyces sp. NBRC 109706]|uniref:tetratricopeptide repeat protein n=1 Tax=Streptomyces sp. NBRC 109706 TaxID=1550035 RepID=UPI000B0DBDF6|nr:tetratricopeptide repeat protein [Streptomyces sp. NBRC 109706]